MMRPHRSHPLWYAFLLHRLSGLGLVLFLPAHFYVLSLALTRPEMLDGFLGWAEHPLVKASEVVLIFLLAVHLFGGLRLLALEFLPWSPRQKTYAAAAAAASLLLSTLFFLSAV